MLVPFETLLALLIIEISRDMPPSNHPAGLAQVAWTLLAMLAGSTLLGQVHLMRMRRRLKQAGSALAVHRHHRRGALVQRLLIVVLFAGFVSLSNWPVTVHAVTGPASHFLVDELLLLLPFVLALILNWLPQYRLDRLLSDRSWSVGEYLVHHMRYALYIAIPWLMWRTVADVGMFLPEDIQAFFVRNAWLSLFGTALLVIFFPVIMKTVLGCKTMPPGPMRTQLEDFCRRTGLSCRDILIWRTGNARIYNAGVMGLVPRYRYVLFTDALLNKMSSTEIEAVLGHELGHVRFHHVFKYLLFLVTFVYAMSGPLVLLPEAYANSIWVVAPVMLLMGWFVFFVLFGAISRRFERQADLESARLMDSPVPLVMALERLSVLSGTPRTHYDWRHDSIANRVRYILHKGFDRNHILQYATRMRRLTIAVVVLGVLGAVGGTLLHASVSGSRLDRANQAAQQGIEHLHADRPARAAAAWQRALDMREDFPSAHIGMALLKSHPGYTTQWDPREALRHARRARGFYRKRHLDVSWRVYLALASAHLALGNQSAYETCRGEGLRATSNLAERLVILKHLRKLNAAYRKQANGQQPGAKPPVASPADTHVPDGAARQ